MPRTVNGIGSWFCRAGFDPGSGWDDAVECFTFLYLPLWPLRTVHVRDISDAEYEALPIRSSSRLVRHVFLRRWSIGTVVLGALVLLLFVVKPPTNNRGRTDLLWAYSALGGALVIGGAVVHLRARRHARRERNLRSLLGPHHLGTSDPLSWTDADLAQVPTAEQLFGTPTYAGAASELLNKGYWCSAAWAIRLSARAEDEAAAARLTEELMARPAVRAALSEVARSGDARGRLLGSSPFANEPERP